MTPLPPPTLPSAPTDRRRLWLKRIGYTIGAIIALILIIVSFVYGASVPRGSSSVHVGDGPRPVHRVLR